MMRNIFAPSLKSAALSCTALVAIATTAIIANPTDAQAQVEEVLITGSLIAGAAPVGVPVATFDQQEFLDQGVVTIGELLQRIPAVFVIASIGQAGSGGNFLRNTAVDIHGLNGFDGNIARTLMLFDGGRFPLQGHDAGVYDPSIVPQLAIERVDVLADGASATYGSDAIAGVVNVILRRGFVGQTSRVRVGDQRVGGENYAVSHLYGRQWDTGDITISFEHYFQASVAARNVRRYTYDFSPWGLDDRFPVQSAVPAIISTGTAIGRNSNSGPDISVGPGCTNCFSLRPGLGWDFGTQDPGPTTTAAEVFGNPGISNVVDPYLLGHIAPEIVKTSATFTFDQRITDNVELFLDGIYSLRHVDFSFVPGVRSFNQHLLGTNRTEVVVPDNNPYLPSGWSDFLATNPDGFATVNYNFGFEMEPTIAARETSYRFGGGFNIELPYDWFGKLGAYWNSSNARAARQGFINFNHFNAALGHTIDGEDATGSTPGIAAFTKPDNIPFLNLFCDPTAFTCNSPSTIDYINGGQVNETTKNALYQMNATFDGPLFELPGGEVQAAVGATWVKELIDFRTFATRRAHNKAVPAELLESISREFYAAFGQLIVPVIGPDMNIPGFNRLDLEVSYRIDHYEEFGTVKNPKFGLTWSPIPGLDFRGNFSKAFRAPLLSNFAAANGRTISTSGGIDGGLCRTSDPAPAGSLAAELNPNCDDLDGPINNPVNISFGGNAGGAIVPQMRPGEASLGPETANTWSLGFDYAPVDGIFQGLNATFTLYDVDIDNVIVSVQDTDPTDPNFRFNYLVKGTDLPDAVFEDLAEQIINHPISQNAGIDPADVVIIADDVLRNLGTETQRGIDFDISYARELGNTGTWNIGLSGNHKFYDRLEPGGDLFNNIFGIGDRPQSYYRGRLGWTDGTISTNFFMNHVGHYHSSEAPPTSGVFTVGPGGSQYIPAFYTFDWAIAYSTNDMFPNMPYLNGLNFQFVMNNMMDRDPPFFYGADVSSQGSRAFDGTFSQGFGRKISLTITKDW
ncbi:MAG: TonB-dependent receptor [Micropepsaceae bacterium]